MTKSELKRLKKDARKTRKTSVKAIKNAQCLDDVLYFGADILDSNEYYASDAFIQHKTTTTLDHQISVAILSLKIAQKLHLKCDYQALIRSSLLHDFYLYDWHEKDPNRKALSHGSHHGSTAVSNASALYSISPKEANIIRNHMFPLTRPPKYREGMIVMLADKMAMLNETFRSNAAYSLIVDSVKEQSSADYKKQR